MIKKIIRRTLIVIGILILLLVAAGYFFRGNIIELVKTGINKNINAKVDFDKVDVSFFRHFPKVSIGLEDLQVTGTGSFESDTLLRAKNLYATVDIMSFIRGKNMKIHSLFLETAHINALVNKNGEANWNIIKEEQKAIADTSKTQSFELQLQKYVIENAFLNYNDQVNNFQINVENMNHTGSGDFTSNLFSLTTKTTADAVSVQYAAMPFLAKVKTVLNATINVDNVSSIYSFDAVDLLLNELAIKGKGNIKSLANGYAMDISVAAPSTEFKHIISLVPALYQNDFSSIKTTGTAILEGYIKGVYSDSTLPGYHLALQVKDGSFKYTDMPVALSQVNFNALVDNPDGQSDNAVIDIRDGHMVIDKDPLDFRLLIKNPVSKKYLDAAVKGNIDLSRIAGFIKLDKETRMEGLLNADVQLRGNVSELEKQQYQNFFAAGKINIDNFKYSDSINTDPAELHNFSAFFTPTRIDLGNFNGTYKGTAFSGNGQVNNLLSYLFYGKPLKAYISLDADKLDLYKWMGISASTTSTTTAATAFVVPANLDFSLNAKVKELKYDQILISNLSGNVQVAEESVKMNEIRGDAFDGTVKINGIYSSKENKLQPDFSMQYDVSAVDIRKTFFAFNTIQKLMPLGKFLSGKLSSGMRAEGKLGNNMEVDMQSLTGNGNLFLIEGFLSKFTPLEKIASVLNVSALESISMKDVKAIFEFSNGKLLLKPFTVKIKDIEMEIGGLQGLDASLNYAINLKLPKSLMGAKGVQLLNAMVTAANAKGIPVQAGEVVNLKMALGGTITQPVVRTDLKETGETLASQMQQQVKDFVQAKADSAKKAVKDTLSSVKKQLGDAALDALKNSIPGVKDSTVHTDSSNRPKDIREKTKGSVKGLLDNLIKKP